MLATTPWIEWARFPDWVGATVAVVGFLAFLVLAGLLTPLGNAIVGASLLALLWRGRGWPFWRAALVSAPFWIVFYRLLPKPW